MKSKINLEESTTLKRELGLAATIAIVVGNTIGSGIFMAPQSLAAASNPLSTIIAWIITTAGSILLALSFAKLGTAMPQTGGPIVYTKAAFGEFPSFLSMWIYWIGCWVADAAIITATTSYLTFFFPILGENRLLAFLSSSAILWIFTIINVRGVKHAGYVGIITTICKIFPLIIFAGIAAFHFDIGNFSTVSSSEVAGPSTIAIAVSITLWSFMGIESATIPAGEIKNPERNLKIATIFGTILTAFIYLIISVLAIGAMSQDKLAVSNAPLADIINAVTGGTWGGPLIAIGAVISTVGTLSGWILLSGRVPFTSAGEKLFPAIFKRVHPRFNTPHTALIISSIGTNLLLITNYVENLTTAFNFTLLLATLSALPVYAFTAAAEMVLLRREPGKLSVFSFIRHSFLALLAFGYSLYAIYGTGSEIVMYGFILMLLGIPVYAFMASKRRHEG